MTISSLYASLDQADGHGLSLGEDTYYGVVYIHQPSGEVRGRIYTRGPDGQTVELSVATIRVPAQGFSVDCPKIVGVVNGADGIFVVHWIEHDGESSWALHRSLFDVTSVSSGWSYQSSITTHSTAQYDVDTIDGDASGFVLTHRLGAVTINVRRVRSPYAWGSTSWTINQGVGLADHMLCIGGANDTDDTVIVGLQVGAQCRTYRYNVSDGLSLSSSLVLGAILDTNDFVAGSIVWLGVAGQYLFAAEVAPQGEGVYSRAVTYQLVNGSGAAASSVHWLRHLHLASRAWAWSADDVLTREAYAWVGYKSIADGQEYSQAYGYVVRFDVAALLVDSADQTVDPIPVSAVMDGSFDARPHGESPGAVDISVGKRTNHLSHVAPPPGHVLGREGKSVRIAHLHYTRLIQAGDDAGELTPASVKVSALDFYHEHPTLVRRDPSEPTQPDLPAWRGISAPACLPLEVPGVLLTVGGVTGAYDGSQVVELGFLWAPEILRVDENSANGIVETGTYWYTATYAWVDRKGQLHRSPPATPISGEITVSDNSFDVEVRTLTLSMKDDDDRYPFASPVFIELWRTTISGGSPEVDGVGNYLFRRVFAGPTTPDRLRDTPENDRTAYSVSHTDTQPNSVLAELELLPFQLNTSTLQWSPPPPIPHVSLTCATLWQQRVFGYDRRVIRWSEQITTIGTQLVVPEFIDPNQFLVDDIGEVVALAAMDSALVVFTRDGVYALVGDPGAGGVGASLQLQVITRGTGCCEARSVVLTPDGVMFQSAKGIYRITRSLTLDYPGAPIEDLVIAAGNVRGATLLEDRHQVRFVLQAEPDTGPLVVRPTVAIFDYRLGLWCTAALPYAAQALTSSRLNEVQHSTSWRGRSGAVQHAVALQGAVLLERDAFDTVYADEDTTGLVAIPLDVETEWVHLSGIAGLKRVQEIGIQCERLGAGSEVTIEAWYDVDGSYSDGAADQTETLGANTDGYIRFRPDIQKVSGFRLRIYESGTVPQTDALRLVTLLVYYATKGTPRRVALQT